MRSRHANSRVSQPRKDVFELHHAGIGEHQGRVVARHERAGGHDLVTVLPEIVEEGRPDLVDATHIITFLDPLAAWKMDMAF